MTDQTRRAAARAAKQDPSDGLALARAEAEHARTGHDSELAWVRSFVGQAVSIEGARINYMGTLVAVFTGPTGGLSSLLIDGSRTAWARVNATPGGDWVQPLGECLVPWSYVHAMSRMPEVWK